MRLDSVRRGMFKYQTPVVLNQAAPVQDTFYPIGGVLEKARVYAIGVNIEDANETLEVQITRDGEVIQAVGLAVTHSASYLAYVSVDAITRVDTCKLAAITNDQLRPAFIVEGLEIEVEVRKTTALGAGNLTGIVTYGVLMDA